MPFACDCVCCRAARRAQAHEAVVLRKHGAAPSVPPHTAACRLARAAVDVGKCHTLLLSRE
jgi:hypothetical protein